MAWVDIPAYVLDRVFGYQSANQLRDNLIALSSVPYIVKSKTTPLSDFLSAAEPLDTLASGYVKNTTGTGALTTVATIPSTDITGTMTAAAHHATHETGGSDALTALSAAVLTSGTVPSARLSNNQRGQSLTFVIASFATPGSTIATGFAGVLVVPWACQITQVTLLSADPSVTVGSIVVDIWKDSYANYPPTGTDTICASARPTLASAIKSQDATLTGWSKALAANDVLAFNVVSVSTVTRVRVDIQVLLD